MKSDFGTMYVGRVNITRPSGNYQNIGKIYDGTLWYYHVGLSKETTIDTYEVLVCQ